MSEPLRVDNSILRIVAECSTQALVRYAHGYTSSEDRAELRAGTAIHEALAAYLSGTLDISACADCTRFHVEDIDEHKPEPFYDTDADVTRLDKCVVCVPRHDAHTDPVAVFDASYREWAEENVAASDRLSWPNTSRILGAWLDAHPLASLPWTTKHVEIGFAFPLADDITFCGRLDAIGEGREDGALYVIEHKSTGNMSPWWLARYRMDSQLSGYIRGAQAHLGGARVVGAILNGIEFRKLPDSDRRCERHAVRYAECGHLHAASQMIVVQRTPQQLVEWEKTALHLARKWKDLLTRFPRLEDITRVRMQGMFNGACRGCPAQDWCAIDRPVDRIASMMTEHRWEPYPVTPS